MTDDIRQGDPLSSVILAVLCNQQSDRKVKVSKSDFEKVPRGMRLRLQSDRTHAWVELVPDATQ